MLYTLVCAPYISAGRSSNPDSCPPTSTHQSSQRAFVSWRNALHAELDAVALLVLGALHVLTLLKGAGLSPLAGGGFAAPSKADAAVAAAAAGGPSRLLSPLPAAAGLHWAVCALAVLALTHAALLTLPTFLAW